MRIYADPSQDPQNTIKSENPNAFSDDPNKKTEKEKLKELHGKKKWEYIWEYYKFPIIGVLIAILVVTYTIYERTHSKKGLFSVTVTNMIMNDDQTTPLANRFIEEYLGMSLSKYQLVVDNNMLVGDDQDAANAEYAYTSQMKLMAYMASNELDIMIMNESGFEYLATSGFLEDLTEVFAEMEPELNETLKDYMVSHDIILNDNSAQVLLDASVEYQAEIENHPFALKLNGTQYFPEETTYIPVYVGIATNSGRKEGCMQFLHYLFGLEPGDYNVIPEK